MRILVVDDEQDICEILQYNLETEGYEVTTANSAEEVLEVMLNAESLMHNKPDLILLDVMMGEMSGFQLARKLKNNPETAPIPIIFITALDGEDDMVKGLNIGADDYIAKPLSMKEVKARVSAVLRRTKRTVSSENAVAESRPKEMFEKLTFETLEVNLKAKIAMLDGELLTLTKLEFELLSLFLSNQGKVFSRNDLLEACWPSDVYVLDRTVDVNITRLRKKIGRYGKCIKTRVGYGYCFDA